MNAITESNLAALRQVSGTGVSWPADPSRLLTALADGAPGLRTPDGRTVRLGSARNRRGEAEALVRAALGDASSLDAVAVIGLGTGAVLEVLETMSVRRIVVLEPHPELATLWLSQRSWTDLIAANRLRLLVGPDYVGAAEAARFIEGVDRIPVAAHPVLTREYPAEMAAARRALDRIVRDAMANADARRRFEDAALLNTLSNLPALAASGDAASLFGRFTGVPAVIVGAGPSLDDNLAAIRDVQDRALVIAADTALLPCLRAGVVPPLVVALDPGETNGRHLAACAAATETHLVTEASVHPGGVDAFAGRTFVFRVGDHAPWPWLNAAGVERTRLSVWGSVVTAALDLALKAGCPAIAFAGLDLAFTGGRPYCRGTIFEEFWAWAVAEGTTLEQHWDALRATRPIVEELDVHGRPTPSGHHLIAFRDWIREVAASHPAVRFVNATGAGILRGPCIEQQPLDAVVRQLPVVGRTQFAAVVARAHGSSAKTALGPRLAARIEAASPADLVRGHADAARATAHVTPARLAGVAARLADAPSASSAAPMTAIFARPGHMHLPEQASLLGALAAGTASMPERPDRAAAAALLHDARRRLGGLVGRAHGVRAAVSVDEVLAAWHRVPARALFAWPPGLAEEVDAVGSLLSEAIRLAGPAGGLPAIDHPPVHDAVQSERAIDPAAATADLPEANLAGAALIWQWALVRALTRGDDSMLTRSVLKLLHAPPGVVPPNRPATRIAAWLDGVADDGTPVRLPFLRGLSVVRAMTGVVLAEGGRAPADTAGPSLAVSLSPDGAPLATVCTIEPESLVARGLPRAHNLSAFSEHEILVGHSDGSGIGVVDASGQRRRIADWPMPVRASIRLGTHGLLAWHFPDPPRLLHRNLATGDVTVIELPVGVFGALARPDGGAYLATADGLWTWQADGGAQPLVRGPHLVSLYAEGDGVRGCARPRRYDDGRWEATTGLLAWQPGDVALRTIPVPAGSAAFAVAERGGWRAEAWLDGCVVRLLRDDGRVFWLACSGPRSLAWAGDSLFVATAAGEVLRFPDVAARLSAA